MTSSNKSWLSTRQIIASEYNGASLVDRSTLRGQFEQQQQQQQLTVEMQPQFDGSSRKRLDGTVLSRDSQGSSEENEQNKKHKGEPTANDLADSLQLLCPRGDDVANELILLDMMDEDDRVRTVQEFLAIHVAPRTTGEDPRNLLTDHAEESDHSPLSLSAANLLQHDRSSGQANP